MTTLFFLEFSQFIHNGIHDNDTYWLECILKREFNAALCATHKPRHDKTKKMALCPAKTQISLVIRLVWSESSLSTWRQLESLATHWAHSDDSDQTGRMPSLSWVFAGRTLILLVLSCRGSHYNRRMDRHKVVPHPTFARFGAQWEFLYMQSLQQRN